MAVDFDDIEVAVVDRDATVGVTGAAVLVELVELPPKFNGADSLMVNGLELAASDAAVLDSIWSTTLGLSLLRVA
jgi:hypothetical protein